MNASQPIKRYFVLGNPIAQSRSPAIHAAFAAQTGIALDYQRKEIPLGQFADHIRGLQHDGVAGVNVTMPFKLDAFACATRVSARAKLAQAANTLKFDGAEIYADNTDGAGLLADIAQNLQCNLQDKSVLLLGAGGAAMGVAASLLEAQLAGLFVLNRSHAKAVALAAQFAHLGPIEALQSVDVAQIKFDVIINATSASLTPSADAPIWACIQHAAADGLAYDMMYGAKPTAFMHDMASLGVRRSDAGLRVADAGVRVADAGVRVADAGVRVADGLGMLVEQAAEAFYLWHGVRPETAPVIAQIRAQLCKQTAAK
jgi:shikimate dehydrogenase